MHKWLFMSVCMHTHTHTYTHTYTHTNSQTDRHMHTHPHTHTHTHRHTHMYSRIHTHTHKTCAHTNHETHRHTVETCRIYSCQRGSITMWFSRWIDLTNTTSLWNVWTAVCTQCSPLPCLSVNLSSCWAMQNAVKVKINKSLGVLRPVNHRGYMSGRFRQRSNRRKDR